MAQDLKPSTWISSWVLTDTDTKVSFPIASIPYMTAAEADADTGDMRKVTFALVEELYQHFIGLASADRPTKMTIAKTSSTNTETGVVTNNFTFRFYTEITGEEVVDEPS